MLTGLLIMMFVSLMAFMDKKDLVPLPTSIDKCPASLLKNLTIIEELNPPLFQEQMYAKFISQDSRVNKYFALQLVEENFSTIVSFVLFGGSNHHCCCGLSSINFFRWKVNHKNILFNKT